MVVAQIAPLRLGIVKYGSESEKPYKPQERPLDRIDRLVIINAFL